MKSRLSLEQISAANQWLAEASPQDILRWAAEMFKDKLTMATAFGAEGCCIIHMLSEIAPRTRIINLDTGYQFPETLEIRERIKERYRIEVERVSPKLSVEEYEAKHGGPLHQSQPDQCCHDRKVVPLLRAVQDCDAWISGIRGNQTLERARAEVVQWDGRFNVVKVNPLLRWDSAQVWHFIHEHHVPYNVLHDRGYPSIGCWPCTMSVAAGLDERAGRWAGKAKKECGLHGPNSQGTRKAS